MFIPSSAFGLALCPMLVVCEDACIVRLPDPGSVLPKVGPVRMRIKSSRCLRCNRSTAACNMDKHHGNCFQKKSKNIPKIIPKALKPVGGQSPRVTSTPQVRKGDPFHTYAPAPAGAAVHLPSRTAHRPSSIPKIALMGSAYVPASYSPLARPGTVPDRPRPSPCQATGLAGPVAHPKRHPSLWGRWK